MCFFLNGISAVVSQLNIFYNSPCCLKMCAQAFILQFIAYKSYLVSHDTYTSSFSKQFSINFFWLFFAIQGGQKGFFKILYHHIIISFFASALQQFFCLLLRGFLRRRRRQLAEKWRISKNFVFCLGQGVCKFHS